MASERSGVVKTFRCAAQMQKTPDVSRDDVLRVIARDFPDDIDAVMSLLDAITCPLIGADRLHLAHLKLSAGSLPKLHESLAIPDSRDVVSYAEHPAYSKRGWSAIDKMSPDEVQSIVDDDWHQYESWLNAE